MAERTAINDLFSQFGTPSRTKLLILGSFGPSLEILMSRFRSLNLEHVSPAELMQLEISRRTPLGQMSERARQKGKSLSAEQTITLMRRWFWSRKPDAGFALSGFPATLLQAMVFDEWLETRNESLDGLIVDDLSATLSVPQHYRTMGLLTWTLASAA